MGVLNELEPATALLNVGSIAKYAWVLFPVVLITLAIGVVIVIKTAKKKKSQWTHTLKVRRVMFDNRLADPIFMKMRRFPLIKKAEVFELENPLLGGYLIPELDEYSGDNQFSIILDKNNRIYTNKGEFFNPDKSSVYVSAKHSEIDIGRANLKANFQNINKVSKRVEWSTIAKYAFLVIFIVAAMVVLLVGISKWGEAQQYKANQAQAEAAAMDQLAQALETVEATVNTQKLEILPMLQEIYKTKNIQGIINEEYVNQTA